MAITLVGQTLDTRLAQTRTHPIPAGYQADDLALITWAVSESNLSPSITGPTGWIDGGTQSLVTGDGFTEQQVGIFYKVLTGSETNPVFNTNAGVNHYIAGGISLWRGVDPSTPIDAAAVFDMLVDAGGAPNAPDITTSTANAALITTWYCPVDSNNAVTGPTTPAAFAVIAGSGHYHEIAYLLDAGAAGAKTLDAWTLGSVAPTADGGMSTIALRDASAGGGNSAPVVTDPGNQSSTIGDTISLQIASSDADTDTVSFSATNLPSGLTISTSGLISGTVDTEAVYSTTVTGDDGNGGTDVASFQWTVAAAIVPTSLYLGATPISAIYRGPTLMFSTVAAPESGIDDFAGDGGLIGYTTYNASALPDVARASGRYRANLTSNAGNVTLHFNNSQGRLDAKQLSFPFAVIARNIGIGIASDSQSAPDPAGFSDPYIFCGLQVHVLDPNVRDSAHMVVGHRGDGAPFTIEGKNTVAGSSSVNDAGANVVPAGRADLRVVGDVNGDLLWYWQLPNANPGVTADSWTLYRSTGLLPGTQADYGTADVYIGLITYASGSEGVPFVGTCDSLEWS